LAADLGKTDLIEEGAGKQTILGAEARSLTFFFSRRDGCSNKMITTFAPLFQGLT